MKAMMWVRRQPGVLIKPAPAPAPAPALSNGHTQLPVNMAAQVPPGAPQPRTPIVADVRALQQQQLEEDGVQLQHHGAKHHVEDHEGSAGAKPARVLSDLKRTGGRRYTQDGEQQQQQANRPLTPSGDAVRV